MHANDKDTQLIWEAYNNETDVTDNSVKEEGSGSFWSRPDMNDLIYKGAEHFEKFRGKADHEDIIKHLEAHYAEFFEANYSKFDNAEELLGYLHEGGFAKDLRDYLGLSGDEDESMFDDMLFDN